MCWKTKPSKHPEKLTPTGTARFEKRSSRQRIRQKERAARRGRKR